MDIEELGQFLKLNLSFSIFLSGEIKFPCDANGRGLEKKK